MFFLLFEEIQISPRQLDDDEANLSSLVPARKKKWAPTIQMMRSFSTFSLPMNENEGIQYRAIILSIISRYWRDEKMMKTFCLFSVFKTIGKPPHHYQFQDLPSFGFSKVNKQSYVMHTSISLKTLFSSLDFLFLSSHKRQTV